MALGMIEVYGFTTAIVVADKVAKSADVKVVAIDKNKPANADKVDVPLVMVVKFEGGASEVAAAMDAGVAEAEKRTLYCLPYYYKAIGGNGVVRSPERTRQR